jgi:hypothetical protein
MLFGVDRAASPTEIWRSLTALPLTRQELVALAGNVAPWLRSPRE